MINSIPDILYVGLRRTKTPLKDKVFLTPYKGIASLFIADQEQMRTIRGYVSNTIVYREWLLHNSKLSVPLKYTYILHDIQHIKEIETGVSKGYIATVDVTGFKDRIKLTNLLDPEREFIYIGSEELPVLNYIPHTISWTLQYGNIKDNAPMPIKIL